MDKLIEKISTYNLFNYLLPGVLFTVFAKYFIYIDLAQGDIVLDIFLYYFIGLVVSRFAPRQVHTPVLQQCKMLYYGSNG